MRPLVALLIAAGLVLAAAKPAAAAPPAWYPVVRWVPAAPGNYDPGRAGVAIGAIVIHATGGSYAGAVSWFGDQRARLSAHYVIRAADGEITQMVAEADTAFQARGFNRGSIGIEHEFAPDQGIGYTAAQYRSSATLVCAVARRYGIPADRAHIIGHSEVPAADHTDPGPTWDWSYYMRLVGECAGSPARAQVATIASTAADSAITAGEAARCSGAGCVPAAGFGPGASGASVALLQWDLASLGLLGTATVRLGEGRFGPQTAAALRAFQAANGVPTTGYYGPLSAVALRRSLAPPTTSVATADLAFGDRSSEVSRLQRALADLGYMDVVSGYFGPVTKDAVRRFQLARGITPTGNYGPLTRAAMALDRR